MQHRISKRLFSNQNFSTQNFNETNLIDSSRTNLQNHFINIDRTIATALGNQINLRLQLISSEAIEYSAGLESSQFHYNSSTRNWKISHSTLDEIGATA